MNDTVFFKNKELVSMFFGNKKVNQIFFGTKMVWSDEGTSLEPTLLDRDIWAREFSTETQTNRCTGFIFYTPTVTHSWSGIQGKSIIANLYNPICGIAELSDNMDGTYLMTKWLYVDNSQNSVNDTGEIIDGNEIYYMKNTYNSSKLLNSWDGNFTVGKLYAITIEERYVNYSVVTGDKTTLVSATSKGFEDWAIGDNQWPINLRVSSHKIYGEILV